MTRDRRLLAASALIVIAALWLFFRFIEGGEIALGPGEDAEVVADREHEVHDPGRARRHAVPPAEETLDEIPGPGLPDHDPRYGPDLYTGDAIYEFEIRDAREQILPSSARLSADLYRLESGARIYEGVKIDRERGLVRCVGTVGDGLEPGRYALRVRAGPYGGFWKDFTIGRGQQLRERLRLKTFTRVIRLSFVDRDDRPLPRLPIAPSYTVKDVKVPDRKLGRGPGILLREPPGNEFNDAIGIGHGGMSGARKGPRAHATLDGSWFLQVVAGSEGKLRIAFSESRDGIGTVEVTGNFLEPEWDDYRMALDPSPYQTTRLARLPLDNPENPGNQRALVVPEPEEKAPDPFDLDESLRTWARIIFHGPEIEDLKLDVKEPQYGRSIWHLGRYYADRRGRLVNGIWMSDVDLTRDDTFEWTWHDGSLLRTPVRVLLRSELGEANRLIEKIDRFAHLPFDVVIEPVSPTFDAWARAAAVLFTDRKRKHYERDPRELRRGEEGFRIATGVALDDAGQPLFGRTLELRFEGDARWSRESTTLPWTPEMTEAARSGEVRVRPRPQGLAFRALDEEGLALPWVEGSLMEIEKFALAEKARHVLSEAGVSVEVQTNFLAEDLDRIAHSLLDEKSDLSGLKPHIGEEIWEALGDNAVRLLVGRNGSWYDPWRKLRGDDRGYAVDLDLKLVPGRRYVLWLWSRSRNAYEPDRVIVFTAAEGLTDLGLITLPRWVKG